MSAIAQAIATPERAAAPSVVDAIRERLERLVITGEIAPGARINEVVLAQNLKVSRSALREAIRMLEHSGLMVLHPNRGVFVRRVSLKEALDLFDVRAGLARTAASLCAMRATEEDIAHLRALNASLAQVKEERDFSAYYDLNLAFHAALLSASGNERLAALDRMMGDELHLFRRRNLGAPFQLEASIQEHARVIAAIEARDKSKAGRAFEQHVLAGKQRMLDTLSEP